MNVLNVKIDHTEFSTRLVEILQQSQFLFQDNFLKNLIEPLQGLDRKIEFLEVLENHLFDVNFDFIRKITWILSKLYYKKSIESQSLGTRDLAFREV